jgi:ABC-type Fe3+/spermidine/putrescine transport system ATPase subunit
VHPSKASSAPILVAKGLGKSYGSFDAVIDVGLEVKRGEFVSILGPSGCGKTTLLRMLAGLEIPSTGTIHIDGDDCTAVGANRRPTNMVFQSYALFPHLNIEDNIAYGLYGKGLSRQATAERVGKMLDLVRLNGLNLRFPHQLSGGQRQRVGLARALACQPKVLLLDEPLSALDKGLREAMQTELRSIQRSVGISFVLVTHDQEEALSLSDRVMVMSEGRVMQFADSLALYEQPASLKVARFVGDINLLQGHVAEVTDHSVAVEVPGVGRIVSAKTDRDVRSGDDVVIGIRPEKISVANGGAPDGSTHNHIAARFLRSAFKGDRYLLSMEIGQDRKEFQIVVQNTDPSAVAFSQEQTVELSWRHTDTMLFDGPQTSS